MEREQPPKQVKRQITKQPLKQAQRQIQKQPVKHVPKQRSDIVTWLENLPLELAEELALYLPYNDITELCQVSMKLSYICKDSKFWRDKSVVDFGFIPQNYPEDINDAISRYLEVHNVNEVFANEPVPDPNFDPTPDLYSKRDELFVNYYDEGDMIMVRYILDKFIVAKQPLLDQLEHALAQRNTEALKYFTKYIIKHNITLSHDEFDASLLGEYGLIDDNFLALMEKVPTSDRSHILNGAARTGNLKLVLYLLGKGITSNDFEYEAARNGQLTLIDYLFTHGIIHAGSLDGILIYAAREGYLDLVKYAIEKGVTNLNGALDDALEEAVRGLSSSESIITKSHAQSLEGIAKYLIRQGADPNIVFNEDLLAGGTLWRFTEEYSAGRIE